MFECLLTVKQVADLLQVSVKTVHQFARSGQLDCVMISPKKRRFFPEQVDQFIRRAIIPSAESINKKLRRVLPCREIGGDKKSVEDIGTDLAKENY